MRFRSGQTIVSLVGTAVVLACMAPPPPVAEAQRAEPSASTAPEPKAAESAYVRALRARLGDGVTLTLEPGLQAAAERALSSTGKAGAVVAIDPTSGRVLALFSIGGERGDPLLVAHHPASTFKPLTTLAALESGALAADTMIACTGSYERAGKRLTCPGVHGVQTASDALRHSCNAFYYDLATRLSYARLTETARRFGYAERSGIELSDQAGQVPTTTDAEATERGPRPLLPLLTAIGHGEIRVTLLEMARAYAAIANGGNSFALSVVASRPDPDGGTRAFTPRLERRLELAPEHLALLQRALVDAVSAPDGHAHDVAIEGFPFAGKSGSATAPPRDGAGEEDDRWFVAYAPPGPAPKILVAARLERAASAKHVAVAVLQAFRDAAR